MSVILKGDGQVYSSVAFDTITLADPAISNHILESNIEIVETEARHRTTFEKGTYRRIFPYHFSLLSATQKLALQNWYRIVKGRLHWFLLQPPEQYQSWMGVELEQGTDSNSIIYNDYIEGMYEGRVISFKDPRTLSWSSSATSTIEIGLTAVYTGTTDKTWTCTIDGTGVKTVGAGDIKINWFDGTNYGYTWLSQADQEIFFTGPGGDGLKLSFSAGDLVGGNTFEVATLLGRMRGFWVFILQGNYRRQARKIVQSGWGWAQVSPAFSGIITEGTKFIIGYPVTLEGARFEATPRNPNFWDVDLIFKERIVGKV